jgi:glycine betaine transporter
MAEGTPAGGGRLDGAAAGVALPLVAAFALWGLAAPGSLRDSALAATGAVLGGFGWLLLLGATAALFFCLWLAVGRHGTVRLGAPAERPAFSTASWIAMLFAAGMGTGLVVWAVAEPVTHALAPPDGALPPAGAARQALVLTYLHWGLHAWGIYALAALVIAWFWGVEGRPPLVSAPLAALGAPRAVRTGADGIAILAIAFGLAGTLVMGVLTLRSALPMAGIATDQPAFPWVVLLGLLAVALASAASGVGRGIRLLSDFNILLALGLMAAVLLLGPSARLMSLWVDSLGAYLAQLPELSFRLRPFEAAEQWTRDWTLTYFLWWLAWGPFVGLFIARISRGRTVREFLAGVVLFPALGCSLWFAIIGGSGLLRLLEEGPDGPLAAAVRADPTGALALFLGGLPFGPLLVGAAILLLIVFIVTSIDSAIFVLAMMTSGGTADPPVRLRLAWAALLLMLAAGILSVASVEVARAMAILGALPYPLILAAQTVALVRALARR